MDLAVVQNWVAQLSRPEVEIATLARQQIHNLYGKSCIGEASNLQKIVTNNYTDLRAKNKLLSNKSTFNYSTSQVLTIHLSIKIKDTINPGDCTTMKSIAIFSHFQTGTGRF